jgi:hypothetical protein
VPSARRSLHCLVATLLAAGLMPARAGTAAGLSSGAGAGPAPSAAASVPAAPPTAPPEHPGMITLRFREHFDVSQIRWGGVGVDQGYYGSTNTMNLWWEKPGRYAFGLAFMPVLTSGYGAIGTSSPRVDDRVKLWNFGLEGKWHPRKRWDLFGPYLRGGAYASRLQVAEVYGGDRWGGSYYVAIGGEVPVWKERIGIAVDLGFRHTILEQDTQLLTFSPSVAIALYFVSDWLSGAMPGHHRSKDGQPAPALWRH